ncbi:MAG: hypothetical protein MRY83_01340 [Flavobacteriales bacterium]|nr:hypothetical protein [Flavobacteriales bacterium]
MSYGIMPYRVNLERLSTRFGNPKSNKRSKARLACKEAVRGMDDDEDVSFDEIIKEMIDEAKASHENLGYMYWYALKGLIEDLGSFMTNSSWYPASCDIFYDSKDITLYDIDSPMDIPTPDDFPTVFVFRKENMKEENIADLLNSLEDSDQKREFNHWIEEAKRYKQDLVLYYH